MRCSNRNRKTSGFRMSASISNVPIIRFKTMRYYSTTNIQEEHFASETDQFYARIGGSRVIKGGNDYKYFPTWEEARDYTLEIAKRELKVAGNMVRNIQALTNPGKG